MQTAQAALWVVVMLVVLAIAFDFMNGADINARGAANAFILQPFANIDARRAYLNAQRTVNARAKIECLQRGGLDRFFAATPRFTARLIVGHNHRVAVKHDALEARIRAHVFAHLFAHEACVAPSGECVEKYPERLPRPGGKRQHLLHQRMDWCEVADKRESRPQADQHPKKVLAAFAPQFVRRHWRLIEFDSGSTITFELFFDPHENFGVHRLRAGIAAKHTTGNRGDKEQRVGRDDQDEGQVQHILGPEHPVEDIELASVQVEQHGLSPVPRQPRQAIKNGLREEHHEHPQIGETTHSGLRVYFFLRLIE